MPAVSKKQQKFFGIVRAIQKGEQVPNTPETAKAAADMKKGDVKKFASTKHKGLPEKKVTKEESNIYNEGSLHKWFKGSKSKDGKPGWVNVKTGGTCASDEPGEGTPKCVSSAKRASMSKSERESASRRKKAADPNQQSKTGAAKPTYVSTDKPKKKVSEAMNFSKFKARAMDAAKKAVAKKSVSKKSSSSYVGQRDAGAIAAKRMRDKEQQKYVGFLPANESVSEAKQEGGYISNAAKAEVRNERRFGKKGSATPTGTFGQGTSEKAKLAVKRGEEHKARRGVKTKGMKEEAYTGPDKEDRKVIKKLDNKDFAKKAAEYEKNMDPKKRQALKDKATKGMKFTHEGTSYGLYKGSGKPSGAMAAFAKKDKEKKKEVKKEGLTMMILGKEVELKEKCWKGYEKKGMKTMFGKRYPNCVKKEEVEIEEKKMVKVKLNPEKKIGVKVTDIGPGGKEVVRKNTMDEGAEVVTEVDIHALKSHEQRLADMKKSGQEKTGAYKKLSQSITDRRSKLQSKQKMIYDPAAKKVVPNKNYKEEAEVVTEVKDKKGKGSGTKDACYHKVKSRYSVWPSAYASGALVKCRKVGAANWGNSSKKEEFSDWKSEFIWEDGDSAKKPVDESFGGSSTGDRAARGDEVGRRERVKRAQEAKAKRQAVKDTPIDKYKPSPAMARYLAKSKEKKEGIGSKIKRRLGLNKEEFVSEDDMKGMSVKSGHKRPTKSGAGMTQKGVEAYRRRNPGSKLKTAVTTKPSKLKKGSKAANRRKSYCARSAGQMKKFPKAAKDPNSRLRQARRRWNC